MYQKSNTCLGAALTALMVVAVAVEVLENVPVSGEAPRVRVEVERV